MAPTPLSWNDDGLTLRVPLAPHPAVVRAWRGAALVALHGIFAALTWWGGPHLFQALTGSSWAVDLVGGGAPALIALQVMAGIVQAGVHGVMSTRQGRLTIAGERLTLYDGSLHRSARLCHLQSAYLSRHTLRLVFDGRPDWVLDLGDEADSAAAQTVLTHLRAALPGARAASRDRQLEAERARQILRPLREREIA